MPETDWGEAAEATEAEAVTVTVFWPDPEHPRYRVQVLLRPTDLECVGLAVTFLRPLAVSTAMRALPAAEIVRVASRKYLADMLAMAEISAASLPDTMVSFEHHPDGTATETVGPPDAAFLRKRTEAHASQIDDIRQRMAQVEGEGTGRRYPEGALADVALVVGEARKAKESTQARVAEVFGVSRSAAANLISRARAAGLFDKEER